MLKKIKFLLLFFFYLQGIFGQSHRIDSLKLLLNKGVNDTTQISILLKIGDLYKQSYSDSALIFYNDAIKFTESFGKKQDIDPETLYKLRMLEAKGYRNISNYHYSKYNHHEAVKNAEKAVTIYFQLNNQVDLAKTYSDIGIFLLGANEFEKAKDYLNQSLEILLSTNNRREISQTYNKFGLLYYTIGDNRTALSYYFRAINVSEEEIFDEYYGKTLINIGIIYRIIGEYDSASIYTKQALEIGNTINNQKFTADCYNSLGNIYSLWGNYEKSLEFYFEALRIYEHVSHKNSISGTCYNIAILLKNQGELNRAIEFYNRSLEIDKETGYKRGIADGYNSIGSVKSDQKDYRSAIDFYKKSLKIYQEIQSKSGIANIFGNIANAYSEIQMIDSALYFYEKSIAALKELEDYYSLAYMYNNVAATYLDLSYVSASEKEICLQKALKNALMAYDLSIAIASVPVQNDASRTLKNIYKELGLFKKSLEYAEIFISTHDSMFRDEKTKAIAEMQTKYETEKKQQEIEKQQLVIEKQEVENRRQRNVRNFFVAGFLLLLALATVTYQGYRQKKRSNAIISEKNAELQQANEEIAAQRDLVMEQKEHIEKIHEEVTSSIRYASRIQGAVLPAPDQMVELLGDHFILFKPKDIVSGDFYWATRVKQFLVFCVADCTGHGVPGAFMSMLGVSFLNDIVHKERVTSAAEILNHLRDSVIAALKQRGEGGEQKDGMDMGLCVIDLETQKMQFAGGYNPCWVVPNPEYPNPRLLAPICDEEALGDGAIIQLRPDKMPIAIHKHMEPYTNHLLQLFPGDQVYLMSDGFQDQFGGPHGKKFMVKNLRELVMSNSSIPMDQQRHALEISLEDWKNGVEQVDDITILGYKI